MAYSYIFPESKEFTLEKGFGRYYMVNPIFSRKALKVVLSLRNKDEAKEFAGNVIGIIKSSLDMRKTARERILK